MYIIVANLFKTLCTKFYQNKQSFIEYMTKHFGLLFFTTQYRSTHKTRRQSFTRVYRDTS